jgi:hypothetical protein
VFKKGVLVPQERRSTLAKMQAIVDKFNIDYPVGTQVFLLKDGEELLTKAKDPAYLLSDLHPVAFFENISGCRSINGCVDKVKVIT